MLHAQNLIDYTHYPLTAVREVPPNILVMVDNSVSMDRAAYEGDFNPERIYDGYFEPSAAYSYSGGGYFYMDDSGSWSGNFLNWLTMRRIDMVRKVLVGGKTVTGTRNNSGVSHLVGEGDGDDGYEIIKAYAAGAGLLYPLPEELGLNPSSPVYFGLADGLIYVGGTPDPIAENMLQLTIRVVKEQVHEPDDFRSGEISGLLHSLAGRARLGLVLFNEDGEGEGLPTRLETNCRTLSTPLRTLRSHPGLPWRNRSLKPSAISCRFRPGMLTPLLTTSWTVKTTPSS